jgi:hypothetical protein
LGEIFTLYAAMVSRCIVVPTLKHSFCNAAAENGKHRLGVSKLWSMKTLLNIKAF